MIIDGNGFKPSIKPCPIFTRYLFAIIVSTIGVWITMIAISVWAIVAVVAIVSRVIIRISISIM